MVEDTVYSIEERGKLPKIISFFAFAVVLCLLSDISSASVLYTPSKLIIASLLFLSFILPFRWGLILFMLVLFTGTDISQGTSEAQEFGAITKASVWNLKIGPIRPSWIIAFSIIIHIIKSGHIKLDKSVKILMLYFFSVPFITTLVYGDISLDPIGRGEFITDIKVALMLLLSVVLFRCFFHMYPQQMLVLISCFMGCLIARHAVDFVYWIVGHGALISGVVRVSVDSAKGGVIFLLFYAVYLFAGKGKIITGGILGVLSALLLITYTSRGLWVTALMGILIVAAGMGLKKILVALPVTIIVVIGGFIVLSVFAPETAFVVSKKAESFQTGVQSKSFLQGLDPLRYGSIVNSISDNFKRGGLILGSGYGSYYTDKTVPFPVELTDAFPSYSGATGKFYRIHDFTFHMLFKYGFVGLALLWWIYIVPAWRAYKMLKYYPHAYAGTMICFVGFIITAILQLYWSGKGLFISGFVIATLMAFNEQYANDDSRDPTEALDTAYTLESAEYDSSPVK